MPRGLRFVSPDLMDRQFGRTGKAPARRGLVFSASGAGAHRPVSRWSGLALSQLLAMAFLAGCAWWVLRELELILPNDRVTLSLSVQDALGGVLGRQLLAFGAALLLCNALLGLLAFALARLTEAAMAEVPIARRGWLIAGWFMWLVALLMAANVAWHPASIFADEQSWLANDVAGFKPATLALAATAALILLLGVRALVRADWQRPWPLLTAGCAIVLVVAAAFVPFRADSVGSPGLRDPARPHFVIIGVDSLRNDLVQSAETPPVTPHIDRFLTGAHRFTDTTTPLARTYGSWVALLTGRHPVATNARVNLMPRTLVQEGETLADALHATGYRTLYATDEVRFANIDESFGFDRVITPPVGAVDFLLGYAGDQPLVNLVARSRAGRWLFPSNHANRAAHVTYDPDDFVARLDRELVASVPSLIAIHLTLAHWPYSWSGMPTPGTPQQYRPAYRRAIERVDGQFEQVMQLLAARGVLDNAVVVLVSDHGEALGGPTDSMLRGTGNSRDLWNSLWGHGTSVLSPHQYHVLFAMRSFGDARLPGKPVRHDWPVSLEDIRPTLEELATGSAPPGVDGISLVPFLSEPARGPELAARIRFTETDFNTPGTLAGRYEASGIVDEASIYYELDPASGRVQFRPERLPALMAQKQRAAISAEALLAAIPGAPGGPPRYLFVPADDPRPRVLESPPDAQADPEAIRLWEALQARFAGELGPTSGLPQM